MRSATRAQVLAAADWCAQLHAWFWDDVEGAPDEPELIVHELACAGRRTLWLEASSILYAAALEGGPMPIGWQLAEEPTP